MVRRHKELALEHRDALHEAVRNEDLNRVKELLDAGANANGLESWNCYTPLYLAAVTNNRDIALLLLERGAKVNKRNEGDGKTPLSTAAHYGRRDMVLLLLEKGAEVRAVDSRGDTPLHEAAWGKCPEVALLLLERGADMNAVGHHGWTPLTSAVLFGSEAMVLLFLERGAKMDVVDADGMTLLHHAAGGWRENLPMVLLERGADVKAVCANGRTPLHCAAAHGKQDVALLLLERGADPRVRDADGKTAGDLAEQDSELATLLGGQQALVINEQAQGPFIQAVLRGDAAVAHQEIQEGRVTGTLAWAAMQLAIIEDKLTIFEMILDAGLCSLEGDDGLWLIHVAVAHSNLVILKTLLERGASMVTPEVPGGLHNDYFGPRDPCPEDLLQGTCRGTPQIVKMLLKGQHMDAEHFWGLTPLHRATRMQHAEMVKMLLDKGASLTAKDTHGHTPLIDAVTFYGDPEIIKILLEAGSDFNGPELIKCTRRADNIEMLKAVHTGGLEVLKPRLLTVTGSWASATTLQLCFCTLAGANAACLEWHDESAPSDLAQAAIAAIEASGFTGLQKPLGPWNVVFLLPGSSGQRLDLGRKGEPLSKQLQLPPRETQDLPQAARC